MSSRVLSDGGLSGALVETQPVPRCCVARRPSERHHTHRQIDTSTGSAKQNTSHTAMIQEAWYYKDKIAYIEHYRIAGNFCWVKFSLSGFESVFSWSVCPEPWVAYYLDFRGLIFRFGALRNKNKTQRNFPAIRYTKSACRNQLFRLPGSQSLKNRREREREPLQNSDGLVQQSHLYQQGDHFLSACKRILREKKNHQ